MEAYFIKLYVKIYINYLEDKDYIIKLSKNKGCIKDNEIQIFINDFIYNEMNQY